MLITQYFNWQYFNILSIPLRNLKIKSFNLKFSLYQEYEIFISYPRVDVIFFLISDFKKLTHQVSGSGGVLLVLDESLHSPNDFPKFKGNSLSKDTPPVTFSSSGQ